MYATEILHVIGGCLHDISLSHGLYLSLFAAGLVGGFTHCAAMCGPFVLSQGKNFTRLRGRALLPYHLGRMTTYVTMAALLSGVINIAFLFLPIRSFVVAPILMLAGLIFFATAFPRLLTIFPWVAKLGARLPNKVFGKIYARLSAQRGTLGQYGLGVLLGFMPCGLIISALLAATTAPNAGLAALAMAAFALGTIPALMGVSIGGGAFAGRYPNLMQKISQGAMVWSGLWLFAMAGFLLI